MDIKEVNSEEKKVPTESKDAGKNTAAKSGEKRITGKKDSPSAKEAAGKKKTGAGEKTSKTSNEEKTVKISIDNTPEEVVQLDSEGKELYFEDSRDRFLELPSDAAGGLGFYNKQRYFTARNIMMGELDLSGADGRRYKPQPGRATAAEQMSVYGKDPRFHYCWKRPDELRQAQREGYRIANDPNLDTFYGDAGSSHTVGFKGQEEMVLTKIPVDDYEARKASAVKKSKARRAAVEENAIADMLKGGGKPSKEQED